MSKSEIFITNAINISAQSFYPRNYDPKYLFVRDGMLNCPVLSEYVIGDIKGGSTPPAYFSISQMEYLLLRQQQYQDTL